MLKSLAPIKLDSRAMCIWNEILVKQALSSITCLYNSSLHFTSLTLQVHQQSANKGTQSVHNIRCSKDDWQWDTTQYLQSNDEAQYALKHNYDPTLDPNQSNQNLPSMIYTINEELTQPEGTQKSLGD